MSATRRVRLVSGGVREDNRGRDVKIVASIFVRVLSDRHAMDIFTLSARSLAAMK